MLAKCVVQCKGEVQNRILKTQHIHDMLLIQTASNVVSWAKCPLMGKISRCPT